MGKDEMTLSIPKDVLVTYVAAVARGLGISDPAMHKDWTVGFCQDLEKVAQIPPKEIDIVKLGLVAGATGGLMAEKGREMFEDFLAQVIGDCAGVDVVITDEIDSQSGLAICPNCEEIRTDCICNSPPN